MAIQRLAVIGAGTMGHGLAQVFAQAGLDVTLTDDNTEVLGQATERIRANLQTCFEHRAFSGDDEPASVLERITVTPDLVETISQADLVLEAVSENLEPKHEILGEIEDHTPPDAILTSTTSGYCVRDLATALDHPERFLVTHFWNPPYIMPVVEVMPGDGASAGVVETTLALPERAGKVPVLIKKDVPGFVGNRLQHALRREAIAIVAQGIPSPRDVDLVARLSFGLQSPIIGPLEGVDLAGLDLTQAIQGYLLAEIDRSMEPAELIDTKVARGELGAKVGRGFYDWPPGQFAESVRQRDIALLA